MWRRGRWRNRVIRGSQSGQITTSDPRCCWRHFVIQVTSSASAELWPPGTQLFPLNLRHYENCCRNLISRWRKMSRFYNIHKYRSIIFQFKDVLICSCISIPESPSSFNPLTAKLFNLNFHPLEIVSRWRDPQLQVSENYSDLTKWRSTVFKYCWLMWYFIFMFFMFKRWYLMC